ncbi:MAG TPA: hypothetical protein DCX06_01835 [Opitutae bacterium]|nr:hypothetical protein [Opitutae bacterium]
MKPLVSQKETKTKQPRPRKRHVSLRKKVLIGASLTAGLAAVAFKTDLIPLEKADAIPPQPQVHTNSAPPRATPKAKPVPNLPPLPAEKSEYEFRRFISFLVRGRVIPSSGATIRQSPNGRFRWEYESPSYADENEALGKFAYIKADFDALARQAANVWEVPIPELHERFLIGSHFRTYRDSILVVIERLGSRYRVVVIIQ